MLETLGLIFLVFVILPPVLVVGTALIASLWEGLKERF